MAAERRRRTRVPLQISVTVTVGSEDVQVQTWNLSLRGMGCTPDRRFTQGSACRVTCTLGSGSEFGIDGSIVRCSEKEAAVFFDSMDEEAFYHLKRLVQYNTTDPDSIDRELAEPFYQAVEKRPPSVAGLLRRTGPSLALRSSFVTAAYEKYASFLIISRALHLNVFEQPV